MAARVVFTGGRFHRYTLDGEKVPSVTTIRNVMDKPGLLRWSAKLAASWAATNRDTLELLGEQAWVDMAAGAADRARDESMDTGTRLHQLAEALLYGDPLPERDDEGREHPPELLRMAEQAARFLDAWQVVPICHEAIVFHEEHRWAGRLDLVGDLSDGRRWLLDWKTGQTGVWPETALQLAAYAHATHIQVGEHVQLMTHCDAAGAVWIRPDSWQLIPVEHGDQTYAAFRTCQQLLEWSRGPGKQSVGGALAVPA